MTFLSPLVLLGLLPIAAIAIWLMRRQADETAVPFIQLWPADAPRAGSSRRLRRLPWWIMLLLLAATSGVMSAAGVLVGASFERPIHLIIDRGAAISAIGPSGAPQFVETIEQLVSEGDLTPPPGTPGGGRGEGGSTSGATSESTLPLTPSRSTRRENVEADAALRLRARKITFVPPLSDVTAIVGAAPSSLDTAQLLSTTMAQMQDGANLPRVIVTNSHVQVSSGAIVVAPPPRLANAGIVSLSAAGDGPTQLMIVLQSDVDQTVTLRLRSNKFETSSTVSLKAGEPATTFSQLDATGEVIEARIEAPQDSLGADDAAWLIRQPGWPAVTASAAAPAAVARFAEAYRAARPARENQFKVQLAREDESIDGPAVLFSRVNQPLQVDANSIEVLSDLARGIDWPAALSKSAAGPEPDASWRALVRAGGRTIIAERGAPPRRMLVNFWSESFVETADFVVLLGALVDSFATSAGEWTADPIFAPPPTWKLVTSPIERFEPSPGVYRDDAGALHALNCVYAAQPVAANVDALSQLQKIPVVQTAGADLSRYLSTAALLLMLLALAARLTAQRAGETMTIHA